MTVAKPLAARRRGVMDERRTRSNATALQKPKRFGTLAVPTVLRFRAMRFVIYFNDHQPAHVHVELPGAEVVAILDAETKTARIRDVRGNVRPHELARINAIIAEHFETLVAEWKRHHPCKPD
jgi:Domain of unknown function (DUF4160)